MIRKICGIALLFLAAMRLDAQPNIRAATLTLGTDPAAVKYSTGSGAPVGACVTGSIYTRTDGIVSATTYDCEAAAWVALGAGGGGGIGGSGTVNTIPKFTAPTTLGNSGLVDDGVHIQTTADLQRNFGTSALRYIETHSLRFVVGGDGAGAQQATFRAANGAPAGACTTGDFYSRTDGGAGTTSYDCEGGAWVPLAAGGGGTVPGGPVTSFQFNNGGGFGGTNEFEWDAGSNQLLICGSAGCGGGGGTGGAKLNNNLQIGWEDHAGTKENALGVDNHDDFYVGFQQAPTAGACGAPATIGCGNTVFMFRGSIAMLHSDVANSAGATSNLSPATGQTLDLGTSQAPWNRIVGSEIHSPHFVAGSGAQSGTVEIFNSTTGLSASLLGADFSAGTDVEFLSGVAGSGIHPGADATNDLGFAGHRWRNAVFSGNITVGSCTGCGGGGGGITAINAQLGPAITLAAGTGLSVASGANTVTYANTGVLSFNGATGAVTGVSSFNGSTGAVTGVSSITGTANEIIASASTGAVTLSTPQPIGTGSAPTFSSVNGTNGLATGGATRIDGSGNASFGQGLFAGLLEIDAGLRAGGSTTVLNSSGVFVGPSVNSPGGALFGGGVRSAGYNLNSGAIGQTWEVICTGCTFTINASSFSTLSFQGGVLVSAHN